MRNKFIHKKKIKMAGKGIAVNRKCASPSFIIDISSHFCNESGNAVNMLSAKTVSLMQNALSVVHIRSCEIHSHHLQVQELIGEGQFGLIHKGMWNGRKCAIKKLKGGITKDSVQYQRLLIELAILSGVGTHPNIVGFFGACIQDLSSPMIVEELVEGIDLKQYLSEKASGFNLGRSKVT